MNIHIIGAGSLGLLFGGRLAASGAKVTFWCHSRKQAELLGAEGIVIERPEGSLEVLPSDFEAKSVEEWFGESGPAEEDAIFLMVKQGAVAEVAEEMLVPYRQQSRRLLCFQNGTGHMELLKELLPEWTLYAAVTTEGAKRTGAGKVTHAGSGTTWIGQAEEGTRRTKPSDYGAENTAFACEVTGLLERAGFQAFLSKELNILIYRKLLINAVINPLTALWRIPNGELLEGERRISLMKELYEEGTAVYDACGIAREEDLWEQILKVCRATSANTSSMLKDVLEGRPTEIASINGSIVRLGEQTGVDTPLHRTVWKLVEGIRI